LQGAGLHLLEPGGEKDPSAIIQAIEHAGITVMHFVPSMLQLFLDYVKAHPDQVERLRTLKHVFASGEALTIPQVEDFYALLGASGAKLINLYGPTEATIDVSYYDCQPAEVRRSIPIGKPIDNIRLYIVNEQHQLQPIGVAGELCISGVGLARGYLNREELTKEKFVDNPFEPGERMYKTGDLARWQADGTIEYLGRTDFQVKIRGYRIELGEIEHELLQHEAVSETVVTAVEDATGSKALCAYVVSSREVTAGELKEHLLQELPDYMVPAYFVRLERMPLTANGKADRKALPKPEQDKLANHADYIAPKPGTQQHLAEMWTELLGVEQVGAEDDFFHLGGHSLKAVQLTVAIQKTLGAEVSLREVFAHSRLDRLAEWVDQKQPEAFTAIPELEEAPYYALSSGQTRLYLLHQMEHVGTSYHLPAAMRISGKLNLQAFKTAFEQVISRHESLRTTFEMQDGRPVQVIHKGFEFQLEQLEGTGSGQADEIDKPQAVDEMIRQFIRPFNLKELPLFRVGIHSFDDEHHLLLFDMHHLIADGLSIARLQEDVITAYEHGELDRLPVQYRDYAHWSTQQLDGDRMQNHEQYWLAQYADGVPISQIPTDYPRPAVKGYAGSQIVKLLTAEETLHLRALAIKERVTLTTIMMAAFSRLMMAWSGQRDVVIGTPVSGRTHSDVEQLIGMFVNTLPIRMKDETESELSIRQWLLHTSEHLLESMEHQAYPFDQLVEKLNVARDMSRNPLFDVMFVMQNTGVLQFESQQFDMEHVQVNHPQAKFDLTLEVLEQEDGCSLRFEYSTALFHESTIQRMADAYCWLLEQIAAASPEQKVIDLQLLRPEEQQHMMESWNRTEAPFPDQHLLHERFEEQVARHPHRQAISFGHESLTYAELNARSNRLARYLQQHGVEPDSRVAILSPRKLDMMIGIFAVLKAGGAYVPISPDFPEDRIAYMLEDSGASLVLRGCQTDIPSQIDASERMIIDLDDDAPWRELDESNLSRSTAPDKLAYMIYTSGSTGKPKGTMIEHRAVINRLHWMQKRYPLGEADTILQKTPYTFDVSVWELFWWSLEGAGLHLLEPGGEKDPSAIIQAIEQASITVMHFVPSMLQLFLDYVKAHPDQAERLRTLKHVFASGEALTIPQVEDFYALLGASGAKLINLYGPTEATIDVSYYDCQPAEVRRSIPIGKPIDNIRLYIVNEQHQLQPIGVAGELCISGVGLARGYLNREELTKEKFVDNPFEPGERMYKTGDLARWQADGTIEYLGRTDFQVKIRGYRIELGEIEHELLQHEAVSETVVTAVEDATGSKALCAYVVSSREVTAGELKEHLLQELPDYMVPAYFVRLERMPLTANGKADRKALPKPEQDKLASGTAYVAPRTPLEKELVEIWREWVGSSQQIGIQDNFFDIGGNSLLLLKVHHELEKRYGNWIQVTDLFANATIEQLAACIEAHQKLDNRELAPPLVQLPEQAFASTTDRHRASGFKIRLAGGSYPQGIVSAHDLESVLSAAWMYLFAQLNKQTEVAILTLVDPQHGMKLARNLNEFGSIELLVQSLSDQFGDTEPDKPSFYQVGHMQQWKKSAVPAAESLQIRAVCARKKDAGLWQTDDGTCDLILTYQRVGEELELELQYDGFVLKKAAVKQMFEQYAKLLKILTKQLKPLQETAARSQ
ncbi:amino acid adenylation domain-containing protein, partial [Marinicrinis sediminis]